MTAPDLVQRDGEQRRQRHRPLDEVGRHQQSDEGQGGRPAGVDQERQHDEGALAGRAGAQPLRPGPVGEVAAPPGGKEQEVHPAEAAHDPADDRRQHQHRPGPVLVGHPGLATGLAANLLLGGGLGALGLPGLAGGQHDVVLRAGAGLLRGGSARRGDAGGCRGGSRRCQGLISRRGLRARRGVGGGGGRRRRGGARRSGGRRWARGIGVRGGVLDVVLGRPRRA